MPTLEQLRKSTQLANSYQRLPFLLAVYKAKTTPRADWLRVLGEWWECCDNIGRYTRRLRRILPQSIEPLLMTEEELAELNALPETLTVYRGADRGVNELGICWTLDRDVAKRFPLLMRYRAENPVLLTGRVSKRDVTALKLERNERELIIIAGIEILSIEPINF